MQISSDQCLVGQGLRPGVAHLVAHMLRYAAIAAAPRSGEMHAANQTSSGSSERSMSSTVSGAGSTWGGNVASRVSSKSAHSPKI